MWNLGVMGCKSTELESPSSTLLSGPYPLSFWRNDVDDLTNIRGRCYQAGLEREDELPLEPLDLLLSGGEMSWPDHLLLLLCNVRRIFFFTSTVY